MVTAIIDTSIVIDLLRLHQPALGWISTQTDLGITPIVWLEVLQGVTNKNAQQKAFKLLESFDKIEPAIKDFSWAIEAVTKYHLSHNIDAFDALIAASSYRMQIPLYTRNLKHFSPMLGNLAQQPY